MARWSFTFLFMVAGLISGGSASALSVPFTETFSTDAAGWVDSTNGPLTYVASGGADGGGYVSEFQSAINDPGTILFRGNLLDGASGGAFAGDWVAEGVSTLSAFVRHDLPVPVSFFFRITTGINFPAVAGVVPVPVLPNTWTEISLDIDPSNPLIIPEFGDFFTTFGDVTNVQVGVSVPLALEGFQFTTDLDSVATVPEPSTGLLLGAGLLFVAQRRRAA